MRSIIAATLAGALCATGTTAETPIWTHGPETGAGVMLKGTSALVWQVKNDKAASNGKKPKHAKAAKPDKPGKPDRGQKSANRKKDNPGQARKNAPEHAAAGKEPKRQKLSQEDRDTRVRQILDVRAPNGRDMSVLLGTGALLFARPDLAIANVPDDDLVIYRNCPPGLAKKDPPCVPPGLAKKGVTYEEWAGYGEDEYIRLWEQRRPSVLDWDVRPDDDLLLSSDQIAVLYGLGPAPQGQRYALIDGMPVLLDQDDYTSLLLVNQLAELPGLAAGLNIAPTAALTQTELQRLYRLPALQPGQNYAVLNGQVVRLTDSEYETLQLIRIARAVL